MSLFAYDGMTKVTFVKTIADISGPTTAELTANDAIDLSDYLTKDGWQPQVNNNSVDAGKLSETFDANVPGTWGGSIEITCLRNNEAGEDLAWSTLKYGLTGYAVVRFGQPEAEDYEDGDRVEVWPVIAAQSQMGGTSTNTNATFTTTLNVPSQPDLYAIVGGGS